MTVLVLDGNENQAVAAVRSLHRAGHRVVVGAATPWSKAGWSRFCARQFVYPAPEDDATAFVASIAEEAARERGTLVLPMTERTTLPLSRDRDRLATAGGVLVLPAHDVVVRAFDKQETTRLAASLGIDVPRTVTISNEAEAHDRAAMLPYPVVVKPRSSQEFVGSATVRTTGAPLYARSAGEFLAAWKNVARRARAVLVQEFIEGDGVGYFALLRHGELRAEFAHQRLRDVRPTGSGSALRVSVAPDPRVRQAALAILTALEWHGVAMVEFRRRSDGTPVFLEVNGRFWNSLALAVHAGVDFPALVARLAADGDVDPIDRYRTGVRCRWLLGDVRHLVEVWRGRPRGFPGRFPGRLRTLASILVPVPGTWHDNFSLTDPLPEVGDWLDFVFRRLRSHVASRATVRVWNVKGRPSRP
jgi:predicted ATP-grasp superfamily ATP-dependent carboligase